MILKGVGQVAPTALMLSFAVLYFAIMMDAGLFDPLVNKVLAIVGEDPMRISLGTASWPCWSRSTGTAPRRR
jgi:CitMHS family citrate-Mg2+:H+ or citrate-Ca2+:H+ symporter